MNVRQLQDVACLLRRDSLSATTAAGSGHPTSCLSAADIVATLFFDELKFDVKNPSNLDNDEFVLSKGHAAPLLYAALRSVGCIRDDLLSLRKAGSRLEGHPVPSSLPWVKVATGSLGQGLGVGVGMALASKLQGRKARTFVLLGDSEVAEGSVFEALQLASFYRLDNLVAFVDTNRLGQRGQTLLGHKLSELKRRFSGFGWEVFVVDGHDVVSLKAVLRKARLVKRPVLVIARTFKGKGVSFVEDRDGWHGKPLSDDELVRALEELPEVRMPKFSIKKPKSHKVKKVRRKVVLPVFDGLVATRKAYGVALASLARARSDVIALDAETSNSTFANEVQKFTPDQFVECFIAEQNMVSVASGLSTKGFVPFSSSFAAFLTRAFDQLRMASLSSLDLTVVGSHAGVSIGQDGASQMGLEDIALFRSLPGSTVLYPSDAVSAAKLTVKCADLPGVKYLRTSRPKTPVLYGDKDSFPLGGFKVLRKSSRDKAVFVGCGVTVHEALKAHDLLKKKGVHTAVVDLYCIKPFNHKKFFSFVKKHGSRIVLAEDHRAEGGVGEMVFSHLKDSDIKFKHKHLAVSGIPHSATSKELLRKHNIDAKAYVKAFKRL